MTGKRNRPLIDRLMERVDAEGDCWIWIGRIGPNGYGIFSADGQGRRGKPSVMAHRMVWGELVGDIPDGLELDHLCRNRPCVNPDHLEPVTRSENILRGSARAKKRALTECAQGHAFTAENTFTDKNGWRGVPDLPTRRELALRPKATGTRGDAGMKPNAELAWRVLDHIDAHPEQWRQDRWVGESACGTVGCFAGWTVMLSGGIPIIDQDDGPMGKVGAAAKIDGHDEMISDAAQKLLGASRWIDDGSEDEWDLFDSYNSRKDLGRLVAEIFGPRPGGAS